MTEYRQWHLWCPYDIFNDFHGEGPVPRSGEKITIYLEQGGTVSFRVTDVEHFPVPEHLHCKCVYGIRIHATREEEQR